MLAIGGLSFWSLNVLHETDEWETHTYEVLANIERITAHLVDAETGQRGYLIAGQERYLEPYNNALCQIKNDLTNLKELTKDNPNQRERLDRLEPLIVEKLAELKETVDLRTKVSFAAAQKIVLTDKGKNIMDNIRQIVAELINEENELLALRKQLAKTTKRNSDIIIIIGSLAAMTFALIIAVYVVRSITNAVTALMIAADQFGQNKLAIPIKIKSKDELGSLAVSFNKMAKELRGAIY